MSMDAAANAPIASTDGAPTPGAREMAVGPDGVPRPHALTVAAFDLDGTITRGGSTFTFLVWAAGFRRTVRATISELPTMVRAAIVGGSAADAAKEQLFGRLLAGMPEARLAETGRRFAQHHLHRRLRPAAARRIAWHRQQGHVVVLVSASVEHYVGPIGEMLGADGAIGTRLAVGGGGLLTGRLEGRNCRGSEKYSRLAAWMRESGLAGAGTAQPTLWAYGNARGDLRLLEAADHGVDAGLLRRLGRLRRYPTLARVSRPAGR